MTNEPVVVEQTGDFVEGRLETFSITVGRRSTFSARPRDEITLRFSVEEGAPTYACRTIDPADGELSTDDFELFAYAREVVAVDMGVAIEEVQVLPGSIEWGGA